MPAVPQGRARDQARLEMTVARALLRAAPRLISAPVGENQEDKCRDESPDHKHRKWVTLSGDKACPACCDSPSRHECPRHVD
jgi:hypothetical protein